MQPNDYKEVRYDLYCGNCRFKDNPEDKEPCNECLSEFINLHSIKPVKYVKKEGEGKK